jgi:hypothetical protein
MERNWQLRPVGRPPITISDESLEIVIVLGNLWSGVREVWGVYHGFAAVEAVMAALVPDIARGAMYLNGSWDQAQRLVKDALPVGATKSERRSYNEYAKCVLDGVMEHFQHGFKRGPYDESYLQGMNRCGYAKCVDFAEQLG